MLSQSMIIIFDFSIFSSIEHSKILANKKDLDQGWTQLPKNKTQVKDKLVHSLLVMRKLGDDGKYTLLKSQLNSVALSILMLLFLSENM